MLKMLRYVHISDVTCDFFLAAWLDSLNQSREFFANFFFSISYCYFFFFYNYLVFV